MTILTLILALLFPRCATEDAQNCYWDAQTNGNRVGNTYIDIRGTAYYL